jgi:D-amino peptidase
MKVFISVDMEGVAGIVAWEQCLAGGDDYAHGRALLLGEVNAAIAGAHAAGFTEICVNDAHSVMRNLPPEALDAQASYLSGKFKPLYMMQGLDSSYDAIVFLGYHAAIATPGALSHTYNPRAVTNVRINGQEAGESGLNALVAAHFRVPVAAITGDQHVGPEAARFCPGITQIAVKESISRYAAQHLHPTVARDLIRGGVHSALSTLDRLSPPEFALPITIDIDLASPDMAEQATWLRGVERTGGRAVRLSDDAPLRLFQAFVTLVYLTRSLAEAY